MYLFLVLKKISENQPVPVELDGYVKKLNNARRRVMLVNNILQNSQVCMETDLLHYRAQNVFSCTEYECLNTGITYRKNNFCKSLIA